MRDCSWVREHFPKLHPGNFVCSSDRTRNLASGGYNCIAWAAGSNDRWWWPTENDLSTFWPPGLPREPIDGETLENFILAFSTLGFVTCSGPEFEEGVEKVAIFVGSSGTPKHAARSLPNGKWTSKLGEMEDIEHECLEDIEGSHYGTAVAFLKRRFDREPFLNA